MNKKHNPLVSIIIPTYNRANLIRRSINSILNQKYQNFEIIVVDDGSTDNTMEIVGNFNEDKIKYYKHKINKGAAAAMNTGIEYCRGDFIAFQGSDDLWLPEKLEKEMKIFKKSNKNVGVVYSGYFYIRNNKKKIVPSSEIKKKDGYIQNELLNGNFVSGLSVIRKICFQKVGLFDENLPNLEDWELYIRISKYFCFQFVDEPLSIVYCSSDSESINYCKNLESSELILEKHFDIFSKNRSILAVNQANIGLWAFLCGQEMKSRKYLINAIKFNPLNIKCLIAFMLSFLGKKYYNVFLDTFFIIKKSLFLN